MAASKTVTVTLTCSGKTPKGLWLGRHAPKWSRDKDVFIPFSVVVDCDTPLDEIEPGDEIEIEIPLWLAREKEMAE